MKTVKHWILCICLGISSAAVAQGDPFGLTPANNNTQNTVPFDEDNSDGIKVETHLDAFLLVADNFLKQHVISGAVHYKKIKQSNTSLKKLIEFIAGLDLTLLNDQQKKAFYINAYNLLVIQSVVDHYPTKGANTVAGFFDKIKHQVAGVKMSLDEVEAAIVSLFVGDPRVHFALVSSAKNAPTIANYAFVPTKLELQLERRAQLFMNNPDLVYSNSSDKKVYLSPLFKKYANEFKPSLLDYVNSYRTEKLPTDFSVQYYPYDWSLNAFEDFTKSDKVEAIPMISILEYDREVNKGNPVFLLDARTPDEFNVSRLKGARRVGCEDFSIENIWMIDHEALVLVYGSDAEQCNQTGRFLKQVGFTQVRSLGEVVQLANDGMVFVDGQGNETTTVHVGKKDNLKNLKNGKGVTF